MPKELKLSYGGRGIYTRETPLPGHLEFRRDAKAIAPTTLYPLICWGTKHTAGHGVGVGRRRLRPSAEKMHCLQGAAASVICTFLSGDRRAVNMHRQLGERR